MIPLRLALRVPDDAGPAGQGGRQRLELSTGRDTPFAPGLEVQRSVGTCQEIRANEECAGNVARRGHQLVGSFRAAARSRPPH